MARRYSRRPRRRRDRYDEYDSYGGRRRRRGGCLAPVYRFFRNLGILLLVALGSVVVFLLLLLIAFHFALFIQIMVYVFWVAVVVFALWIIYLLVLLITSISARFSEASERKAKAKIANRRADIEYQRVNQAQLQVERQEAKIEREAYQFYEQRREGYYQSPRRTRNFREEEEYQEERPQHRTRNFRQEEEPLVRMLAAEELPQKPLTVPSISQLLGRSILFGQRDMLYGFEMESGSFVDVRGDWPGTAIIAGKSGSGKTRRVIIMVFQAILAGMRITICDPHSYKPDGLIKVLMPFAPWLTFARSESEITAAANEHIGEFESRLSPAGSIHNEGTRPRLIVFDEFPALMKSDSIVKEDKRSIAKCVRESATQYRGLGGFAWIIGQEFTEDAIFDTAIRKDAHAVLCHQLSDEYVRFLFPRDLKTQRLIQQIARRECVFKDGDNNIKRIATPTVLDEEIPNMVAYLERVIPPHSQAPSQSARSTATLHSRQTEANPPRVYGAPARQQQIVLLGPQNAQSAPLSQPLQPHVAPRIPRRPTTTEPVPPIVPQRPRQQRAQTARISPDQQAASAVWGGQQAPVGPKKTTQFPPPVVSPMTDELAPPVQRQGRPLDTGNPFDALANLRDQQQQKRQR